MKFLPIYRRVLLLWPEDIAILDGRELAPTKEDVRKAGLSAGKCYYFPMLSKALREAEAQVDPALDVWGSLMVWTMFQEFHRTAMTLLQNGDPALRPGDIPVAALEQRFRTNLNVEGWETERDTYEGL